MAETWTDSDDLSSATVTGRVKQPWWKKIQPWWWLMNDEEPRPPADMYQGKPEWLRLLLWYLRNPFQNFGKYVIGVYDRNYTVTGTPPVCVTAWNDMPDCRLGWKFSVINIGILRLPFVSYVGKRVMWYAGFQWWGFFGFKFNVLRSKVQAF